MLLRTLPRKAALGIWLSLAAAAFSGASASANAADEARKSLEKLCADVDQAAAKLKWKLEPCLNYNWHVDAKSVQGRPLIYAEFGDPTAPNKTLVFSAVHGDEVTPVFVGFQLAKWLKDNVVPRSPGSGKPVHVILAPLVNPDGFFRDPKTRMNARGVDVNRNFATQDWNAQALKMWKTRYRSEPRRFPGNAAGSEPETVFQQDLIMKFKPHKILSVHSPLNHMDYDGPSTMSLAKFPKEYVEHCLRLRKRLKAISSGFFPGSLGNFAGQEMGIPTLTLELPTSNPRKAVEYWNKFSEGIRTMIEYEVPVSAAKVLEREQQEMRARRVASGS